MSSDPSSSYIWVEESDFTWAAQQGLISQAEMATLWPALAKRAAGRTPDGGINLAQVAFYGGSLLIIGALTWFITEAWEVSQLLFCLALAYSIVFGAAGVKLWFDDQQSWGIPPVVGGLFVTISVSVAPIAIFAAQRYLDWWPFNHSGILIELTPVLVGLVAVYYIRFPFLMAPFSAGLYMLAVFGLPQFLYGQSWAPSQFDVALLSVGFGLAMDVAGILVDKSVRPQQDFGFWLYLFGSMASFVGLGYLNQYLGPYYVGFAAFSTLNIIAGGVINRQCLVVFGSIGEACYLLWLTNDIFYNSWAYPFVLTAVGLLIIFVGVQLQKYIENKNTENVQKESEEISASTDLQLLPMSVGHDLHQYAPVQYMPLPMQSSAPSFFFVSTPAHQLPAESSPAAPKTFNV